MCTYADDQRRSTQQHIEWWIKRKYRSTRDRLSKCEPRLLVRYLIFFFRFTVLVHSIHLCWVVRLPTVRPTAHKHTQHTHVSNSVYLLIFLMRVLPVVLLLLASDWTHFDMFCATVRLPMCARCKLMRDFRVPAKNVIEPSTCQHVLCVSVSNETTTKKIVAKRRLGTI